MVKAIKDHLNCRYYRWSSFFLYIFIIMIKEFQITEIEKTLNEVFSYLIQEDLDKPSPTFEWDLKS